MSILHAKVGRLACDLDLKLGYMDHDVEVIDINTGKPIVDEAGREYPIIEANVTEGWFTAYTGDMMETETIRERVFEIHPKPGAAGHALD